MAEKTLDARVCLKYDTYENWKSKNTVLKKGEVAQTYVSSTSTIDSTGKTLTTSSAGTIPAGSILYKVGDGTTAYNSLKFTTAIPTEHQSLDNYQLIGSSTCYDTDTSDTSGNYTATIPNITELKEGLTVKIRLKIAPNSTTNTLNINSLGAKTIYFRYGTKLTTHYAKESVIALTYTEDAISSGTDRTGWIIENIYDTTTTHVLRKYYSRYTTKSDLYRYMMCFVNTDDELIPANNVNNSTATTKTLTTESFDLYRGIYYYASATTVTAGNLIATGMLYQQYGRIDIRYSFNTGFTLVASKPIYLVVTPQSDGQVKLSDNPISQDLPSSTTNNLYILLGKAYDTYTIEMTIEHPVYTYTTKLVELSISILDKADISYVDDKVATKTSVTVSGSSVTTFDADTKLDKVSGSDNAYKIYGTNGNGDNIRWNLTYFPQAGGGTIPAFNGNRTITVDPAYNFNALANSDAVNKKYVDDTISNNTLSAGGGITIDDKVISIDYDTLNSESISSSSGHLLINTSYIANNICGNGLFVDGCNSDLLSVNWESIPIDTSGPIYFGSCNQGLNLNYGDGLKVESWNGLCVDWNSMPVDSSTFYIDNTSGLQIQSCNNLLDVGLGSSSYTSYIKNGFDSCNNRLNIVSQSLEIDAISSNGQLLIQGYNNDIIIHNNNLGLIIDNDASTLSIGTISCNELNLDYAYLQIDGGGVSVSHSPTSSNHVVNKKYVDNNLYNENILINGEFNVNQQGTTEYSIDGSKIKTVDMWIGWNGAGTFNASTKVLTNTLGSSSTSTVILQQAIEYYDYLWGKTLTLSAKIDGIIYSVTGTLPSSAPTAKTYYLTKNITTSSGYSVYFRLRYETSTKMLYADIGLAPDNSSLTAVSSITLGFVKLEYGSSYTPIRKGGWNTWSSELVKCQRYYQLAYLHGVPHYAANATTIAPCIRLQAQMRTTPTLSVKQLPTIIGEGASHSSTAMVHNSYWNNIEQVKITTSGLTASKIYVMSTGAVLLDANIY